MTTDKIRYQKKWSENFIEYFSHSKNGMRNGQMCEHQDKKMVVHSKPFIKIISIFLLIVRFVKSSDQAIIQTIRKNKSILMFLINRNI